MGILKHIFRLRDKIRIHSEDGDKPFLEHLDELRRMLVRMIVAVLITTSLCFAFSQELLDIIRYPADQVWGMYENSHLPEEMKKDEWEKAKALAYAGVGLSDKARDLLYDQQPERVKVLGECALIMRAAQALPEEQRSAYYKRACSSEEVTNLVGQLDKSNAVLTGNDGRGSLLSMGAFQPAEGFFLSMKLSFYAGIVLAFPFLMLFLLQFILPGLLPGERSILYKCLGIGFGLFLLGVAFAYWIVLPRVLLFFYEYSLAYGIANEWRIGYYVSFATQMVLLFGVAFELPVVLFPFIKLGVLHYKLMASTRRYAIVGIAVLAAVITPTPDAVTMLLMAVPMYGLYEICVLIAWGEDRRRAMRHDAEQKQAEEDFSMDKATGE